MGFFERFGRKASQGLPDAREESVRVHRELGEAMQSHNETLASAKEAESSGGEKLQAETLESRISFARAHARAEHIEEAKELGALEARNKLLQMRLHTVATESKELTAAITEIEWNTNRLAEIRTTIEAAQNEAEQKARVENGVED